jgi:Tfp pilus assembly protein PilX
MRQQRHPTPSTQRGIGALVVVLVLFFILAMVALYTSRNLIFEQKTSANIYRSTQAFEAAEAGLEWAIAMLNGGRIDNVCVRPEDPVDTTLTTFRDRHLEVNANGVVSTRTWLDAGVATALQPSCVFTANAWQCSCQSDAAPVFAVPAGTSPTPTFRITFENMPGQPGLVRTRSQGCSSFGTPCIAGAAGRSDAIAEVDAVLGLAPSLTQTPAAALTVRGTLTAGDALVVTNTDRATNGVTINSGGAVPNAPPLVLSTLPGNPTSMVASDASLSGLASVGGLSRGEMMFLATFGMPPVAYRTQPAVVRVKCAIPCNDQLQTAANQYPGRVIWIDPDPVANPGGDLVLDSSRAVTLGSVALPVVAPVIPPDTPPIILVVSGDINFGAASNVTINGIVYSRGSAWTVANGAVATINGAFVAEGVVDADPALDGGFRIIGAPSIEFDRSIVDHLSSAKVRRNMDFGSFVRVPGSWRDWKAAP